MPRIGSGCWVHTAIISGRNTHLRREAVVVVQKRVLLAIVGHEPAARRLPVRGQNHNSSRSVLLQQGGSEVLKEAGEGASRALDGSKRSATSFGQVRRMDEHRAVRSQGDQLSRERKVA